MGILSLVLTLVQVLVFARCILSFMPQYRRHPAAITVNAITDPLLRPFQAARMGPLDFSPMVFLMLLGFLRGILHV